MLTFPDNFVVHDHLLAGELFVERSTSTTSLFGNCSITPFSAVAAGLLPGTADGATGGGSATGADSDFFAGATGRSVANARRQQPAILTEAEHGVIWMVRGSASICIDFFTLATS